MNMLKVYIFTLVFVSASCTLTFRRVGWLDKMVAYHKKQLFADVERMLPELINATIEPAPAGYVDSTAWDFDSVMRLITLVRASKTAAPVRRAIHLALRPTRRLYISKGRNTYKLFPSLMKQHSDDFYYDINSDEYYMDDEVPHRGNVTDDSVIYVTNPVEAKLPSARISVRLLKEIMEKRAMAAREMPSTKATRFTKSTKRISKTPQHESTAAATTETTAGKTTAAKETTVANETKVSGETTVGGETTIRGNSTVAGETTVGGNATVAGETTIGGNSTVAGETTTVKLKNQKLKSEVGQGHLATPLTKGGTPTAELSMSIGFKITIVDGDQGRVTKCVPDTGKELTAKLGDTIRVGVKSDFNFEEFSTDSTFPSRLVPICEVTHADSTVTKLEGNILSDAANAKSSYLETTVKKELDGQMKCDLEFHGTTAEEKEKEVLLYKLPCEEVKATVIS